MIRLTDSLPHILEPCAELIKINCNYDMYKNEALFWLQNDGQAIISRLDGDIVIYNRGGNLQEISQFLDVVSPASVFSDSDTLKLLYGESFERAYVMQHSEKVCYQKDTDTLSSKEIYDLLNTEGLELPPYEYFAPDFCRRLNHGGLKYFARRGECAAIALFDGKHHLINGIASHKKGMGSVALQSLLGICGGVTLAVCRKDVREFYIKNGFQEKYEVGYWRKKI